MVIAPLQAQGRFLLVDVPANGLGNPKVHGSPGNLPLFTGGDIGFIRRGKKPGGHGKALLHSLLRLVMTCQIEIAVVGEIEHRILIADGSIGDTQGIALLQGVFDANLGISREALVAVGAFKTKGDGILFCPEHFPNAVFVKIIATVEIVFHVVVFVQLIGPALQRKGCAAGAVGISAHHCAEKRAAFAVVSGIIEAQHHIRQLSIPIRNEKLYQCSTQIGNFGGQLTAADGI